MANVKISELAANAAVTPATDVLPIVHSGATEKVTPQALVNAGLLAPGPIGGGTPAAIAGTTIAGTGITGTTLSTTGNVGIGAVSLSTVNLSLTTPITGAVTAYGLYQNCLANSDATSAAYGIRTNIGTQATSFTCASLVHFSAAQGTFGAGSTVTSQTGFNAAATLVGGGTTNYGFRGQIPTAAGRYNLYMDGTAPNYLAGDLQLNKTITAAGTTGAQTISKTMGSVNFAAAATSLVVTNTLVTLSSVVICQVAKNDTTMKSVQVVQASGSFTIYANAAATAETRVNFMVLN